MNYYKNNIKHVRGDTYSFGMVVEDEVLESVYFTCRDGLNDNSPVLFQKSLGNGISITETEEQDDVTLYKYAIRIDPLDTKDINSGTYYYDLQIELNGDVLTIMKGRFIIEQDCTRSEKVIDEIAVKIDTINGEVVGISVMDKLNYLEDTKNLIKDSLNYLGEEVSDDDTFRSYADVITGLYDYMEKVTDEGTDVTLNNTRVGPLKLSPKGNTQQDTTTGKNLFALKTLTETTNNGITYTPVYKGKELQYINVNGTSSAVSVYVLEEGDTNTPSTYPISLSTGTYILSDGNSSSTANNAIYFRYTTDNSTYTAINSANTTTRNFTISQNAKYIAFIRISSEQTISNQKFYPQLESGSTITSYEPYTNGVSPNPDYPSNILVVTGDNTITISNADNTQTQTQLISLGNIELCKIGDYQDYLYKSGDKWYKKENIHKIIFNGTETGWGYDTTNNYFRYPSYDFGNYIPATGSATQFCNYFTQIKNWATFRDSTTTSAIYTLEDSGYKICIRKADISITDNFKTWLSNHNTSVYYPLANATDIEITDTTLIGQLDDLDTKLKSYDPQTNITSVFAEGNAQMIISATALKKGGN